MTASGCEHLNRNPPDLCDRFELRCNLARDLTDVRPKPALCGDRCGSFALDLGQQEHARDRLLHALAVELAALQACLVLSRAAWPHGQQLQRAFDDGDRCLQLVRGIADESVLLREGSFQPSQSNGRV